MIKAQEQGRRLHITIGDGDGAEKVVIEPVDVETGAALLADFLGVMTFEGSDGADAATKAAEMADGATRMAKIALGENNFRKVQTLRSDEAKDVTYAALFWNTQGGGIGTTNTYLQDGLPKAMSAVFAAAGLLPKRLSMTSQSSDAESLTP